MIDEINNRLKLIASLEDYKFVVGINDGEVDSELFKISNSDLFYFYDNGLVSQGIYPRNITTEFEYYFRNVISPELQDKLIDGILNMEWNQSQVTQCFESYCKPILDWFKTKMGNQKILDVDMRKYTQNLYCKIIFEIV